jgi:tRNA threonylcarbamoyladenosine biosynthesis protein TsaB
VTRSPMRGPQPSRLLLALDTSTAQAGLALYDGRVLTETVWLAGRDHGRQLMPAVHQALDRLGRAPSDLAAVAAASGPGSFTGVRVGLAIASGLAFALGLPLYGIGSLDITAAAAPTSPWPLRAVLEAGRGRFATALYRPDEGDWARVDGIVGVDLDGLVRLIEEQYGAGRAGSVSPDQCAVVGELDAVARARLAALDGVAWAASPALGVRRPGILAEMAWNIWSSGRLPEPGDAEPIYLTRT